MSLTEEEALVRIDEIFDSYGSSSSIVASQGAGKVYEAWVLATVLERFESYEGCQITPIGTGLAPLRAGGGPISQAYSGFLLQRHQKEDLEVWTDIELRTLSYDIALQRTAGSPTSGTPARAFLHELDIVVVAAGTTDYPSPDEVRFAVECKQTGFSKQMARAIIGVRRELSYYTVPTNTGFTSWPRTAVPAHPPSVLQVYSTDPDVVDFSLAGRAWGIDFCHEPF